MSADPGNPKPIQGLDAVDLHTIAMEVTASTCPRRSIQERLASYGADEMSPISKEVFQAILGVLLTIHDQQDHDARLVRIKQQVSNLKGDTELQGFIFQYHQSEHAITPVQSEQASDLNSICVKHGISPYPNLSLYAGENIQNLKPHQLVAAAAIVDRALSPYKHVFLSSDAGTGKTKTYLASLILCQRTLEKQKNEGLDVQFRPSLILTTPESIYQVFREIKWQFPDLNLFVYFRDEDNLPDKNAKVVNSRSLVSLMQGLKGQAHQPDTGRVVILSTYSTWSSRLTHKTRLQFSLEESEVDCPLCFQFVIADEAHTARRLNSPYNNMLRLIEWRNLLWVSATPVMSSFRDLLSPLSLMWKAYGLHWEPKIPSIGRTQGIFTNNYVTKYSDVKPLKKIFEKHQCRLWMINPSLFKAAGETLQWGPHTGQLVVRPVYEAIQVRTTMFSKLTLPDGSISYPAEGLLLPTIVVEDLNFDALDRDNLADIVEMKGRAYAQRAFSKSRDNFASLNTQRASGSHVVEGARRSSKATLNVEEHRKGVLTAFDYRNSMILEPKDPYYYGEKRAVAKELASLRGQDVGLSNSQMERQKKGTDLAETPGVDIEHIKQFIREDTNCGLNYYYSTARIEEHMPAPEGRASWLRWLPGQSPILTRGLQLAWKYCRKQRERFLVYVDDPWIHCIVVAFFTIAGFNVGTIRSCDKASDRNKIIADWNDPASDLNIFVANVDIMKDVDMDHCCSKGAFFGWHLNARGMCQAIGRLIRINQKKEVMFHILKVKNSYHDHIERICITKWANQLSAKIPLPGWMTDEIREICVFEMIKTYWHQSFNRYAWVVEYDVQGHALEYHSDDVIRLGHIFSVVAKLLLRCQPEDQEFWVKHMPVLVEGCRCAMKQFPTVDDIEKYLRYPEDSLRDTFMPIFKSAMQVVTIQVSMDDEVAQRRDQQRQGVQARANESSAELLDNSDEEPDDEDGGADQLDKDAEDEERKLQEEIDELLRPMTRATTAGKKAKSNWKRKANKDGGGKTDSEKKQKVAN
ncbi:hypothetical protein NM208_g10777 [Fusarium decemcellulare]|uniref:Uncharacterized protein n=1 Tax=Fusarium decemcellulare TaxID=57161 RepID=A0ACC1RWN2_9HYPO|nr:hypothetical protein NM208_g10777 [Fusarium decemcellulare]